MPMPKSVTKINKDGVKFVDSVDKTQYCIRELTRAALRDTGKFLTRLIRAELKASIFDTKLEDKDVKRALNRRISRSTQYWARKRDLDLIVGFKHKTWYGYFSETGTSKMKKLGFLRRITMDNIDEMRRIQGQYLSKIQENEREIQSLIDEDDYVGDENE